MSKAVNNSNNSNNSNKRKGPNHGKHRSAPKLNLLTLEPEIPISNPSPLNLEENKDSIQVLIRRTRRYNYIVFLSTFLHMAMSALRDGDYVIEENPNRNVWLEAEIAQKRKRTGNMTLHNGLYKVIIRMDLVYGPLQSQVLRLQPVDIYGIEINGERVIYQIHELKRWTSRAILLYTKEYYPCINTNCSEIFHKHEGHNRKFTCSWCQTEQCPKCQVAWEVHRGLSCERFQIQSEATKVSDKRIKQLLYRGEMQICPKCTSFTQKSSGCNKIKCKVRGCSEIWCWCCGLGNITDDPNNEGVSYNHWFDKHCPVMGSGVFAEDSKTQDIVKAAIRDRNIKLFGESIIPKPGEEQEPDPEPESEPEPEPELEEGQQIEDADNWRDQMEAQDELEHRRAELERENAKLDELERKRDVLERRMAELKQEQDERIRELDELERKQEAEELNKKIEGVVQFKEQAQKLRQDYELVRNTLLYNNLLPDNINEFRKFVNETIKRIYSPADNQEDQDGQDGEGREEGSAVNVKPTLLRQGAVLSFLDDDYKVDDEGRIHKPPAELYDHDRDWHRGEDEDLDIDSDSDQDSGPSIRRPKYDEYLELQLAEREDNEPKEYKYNPVLSTYEEVEPKPEPEPRHPIEE